MNRPRFLLLLIASLAAILALPGGAQLADTECDKAAKYHLESALRYENVDSQVYHLNAATAAERLKAKSGNNCSDWRESARAPTYDPASGKVESTA